MADHAVDQLAVVKEGSAGDQKRLGTFKMHLQELQVHFRDLMAEGVTDPFVYEKTLEDLLRGFETIRVAQEQEIRKLEQRIAYCRARQRAASEHANLILAILTTNANKAIQAFRDTGGQTSVPPQSTLPDKTERVSDKEMLQTICICGCVDDEDVQSCNCECHTVGHCQDPRCSVCGERPREVVKKATKKTAKKAAKRKAKGK
ncbi:MAG: hypothetical protein KJN79_00555 [Gammaproteobacteria bacterium]|nr:hypothetical protein [Gammaproteobacteria bacterium]